MKRDEAEGVGNIGFAQVAMAKRSDYLKSIGKSRVGYFRGGIWDISIYGKIIVGEGEIVEESVFTLS